MQGHTTNEKLPAIMIIPAYRPPSDFPERVRNLLSLGFLSVIVVDDGSGEKYEKTFERVGIIQGAILLTHVKNRGKGCALKTAFKFCRNKYSEKYVFVTSDCDGQHTELDCMRVAISAMSSGEIVFGVRDFGDHNIPVRSRIGNRLSGFLYRQIYGSGLSDTQTGLRAFDYSHLSELCDIPGERFEYEMNVLTYFAKKGVFPREIHIRTVYNTPEGRKKPADNSNFRVVLDTFRVGHALLGSLWAYFAVAALGAASDLTLFYLFVKYIFASLTPAVSLLMSTVSARLISSAINFFLNSKYVFGKSDRNALRRYYVVWSARLAISYATVCFIEAFVTSSPFAVSLMKGAVDFLIAIITCKLQFSWVFSFGEYAK